MLTTEIPREATTTGPRQVCPCCGASLGTEATGDSIACPGCGRTLPLAALAEYQELTEWDAWARQRADWLRDRLLDGDLAASGWTSLSGSAVLPGTHVEPAPRKHPSPPRQPIAFGSLLLAGGAVLLVLAGIAFAAFAWDLLGPAGQLITLYVLGALALLAGVRLRRRLPGTGTTLSLVGTLLVVVSVVATRVLTVDQLGETAAMAASLVAAVLLTAVGLALRSRQRVVGEVAALLGAALTLGLLALAPVDDALPLGSPWAWWPAVVLLAGGVLLLVLAHWLAVVTWPALAGVALFLGSLSLAAFVVDRVGTDTVLGVFPFAIVLLALAPLGVLLVRLLPGHRAEPAWVAGALLLVASGTSLVSGVADPSGRPGDAVALVIAGGLLVAARHLTPMSGVAEPSGRPGDAVALVVAGGPLVAARHLTPMVLRPWVDLLTVSAFGAAAGLAVAPWTDTWTSWRGPLAGLVLAAVLVVLAETRPFARSATPWPGILALTGATAGLVVWLLAVTSDRAVVPDDVQAGIAAALGLWAAACWVEAARRHLPAWSVWLGASAGCAAVALVGQVSGVDTTVAPELFGVALATVAGAAGALLWWLRRPAHTSSLLTLGPALVLLLAPPTLAVVDAATNRWFLGEGLDTAYQVRVVGLLVVSAALVAVGGWQRLAGVIVPGAAVLVTVTVVQLVELGRFLPQWVSFAVAGAVLVAAGARWESVRRLGRSGGTWVRSLR
jgi:hypothetical protein